MSDITEQLRTEAVSYLGNKSRQFWSFSRNSGNRLFDVEVYLDGAVRIRSIKGSPVTEHEALEAFVNANRDQANRRSEAAKKAAETRRKRRELKVYEVVKTLKAGGALQPGTRCRICGKSLTDEQSRQRGIGSDCWQEILSILAEQESI